ncbi:formyltransferase family protein [uncultured Dokdonia sp.]|uniref:formyltransferase family protein n=1 Tax=uncultured Dokdonia sp. TaxID=575653 RepID=UPI0026061CBF|nr:formyltransferase family protein [uncultured Dokdonia sp.]
MRIALFTSNHLRHKYIAAQLQAVLDLVVVITEEKNKKIEDSAGYEPEDQQLLDTHFKDRTAAEEQFFGAFQDFPAEVPHISLAFGTINSEQTLAHLEAYNVDYIVLFGTSIIKPIILEKFPDKVINLHLGLSPYYKGSGTNFFPIVNNEFECIGATIHMATIQVDAGGILHQLRLEELYEDDTIHSIGNRLIEKAGVVYPKIVKAYLENKIVPIAQDTAAVSKEYRIKDFTPDAIRKAHSVVANQGIVLYLKQADLRKTNKPISIASYE